jgi:hypothetical protein
MPDGSWVFIVPVGELYLTETVGREFRVDRVTFVDRDRIPRVRTKLGLGATVGEIKSEIKRTYPYWDFFDSAPAFAVMKQTGEPEKVQHHCLKIIREELSILALSKLGMSRERMGPIALAGENTRSQITFLAHKARDRDLFGAPYLPTAPSYQLVLHRRWKNYQDRFFFTKLLKILRRETKVEGDWCEELRRASVLIGESVGANDLLKSFMWNWVALEMLLAIRRQDKTRETLPKRAEALLGWATYWELENYEDQIKGVYKKRNNLIHEGKRDAISQKDLAFTDHLLFNLLTNLVNQPKHFRSKNDVIEFSEKIKAERLLGVRHTVRPKNLRFARPFDPDF